MNDFYVYVHLTLEGLPFYVGKGRLSRYASKHGRNSFWKRVVKKYGFTPQILFSGLTESEAFVKEIETIKEYKLKFRLCNLTDGGEGTSGWVPSKEVRDKISIKNKGKTHTLESKFLIGAAWRGRRHSEETKELIKSKWYKDHNKFPNAKRPPVYSKSAFNVFKTSGEFVGTWSSRSKCAKELNISQPNISNCLTGKRTTHCGYVFKVVE
jgi:hypothetical protein